MYTWKQIDEAIRKSLNEREQEIVRARFGMDTGKTATLNEIEQRFGVAREEIRRIEKKVLDYIHLEL